MLLDLKFQVNNHVPSYIAPSKSLQWRHNEHDDVSNHLRLDCLLNCLLIKENIQDPRNWPLWGEFPGDRWIPRTKNQ